MADRPTHTTSNYGWSLWHLEQAQYSNDAPGAALHATLAQARATLARVDEHAAARGQNDWAGSTWSGGKSDG